MLNGGPGDFLNDSKSRDGDNMSLGGKEVNCADQLDGGGYNMNSDIDHDYGHQADLLGGGLFGAGNARDQMGSNRNPKAPNSHNSGSFDAQLRP